MHCSYSAVVHSTPLQYTAPHLALPPVPCASTAASTEALPLGRTAAEPPVVHCTPHCTLPQ